MYFYYFTCESLLTVNVALNKPAHQSHPYLTGDTYDASNAVDGLKSNLRFDGGQCVVSKDGHRTAIWWVNLTSIHSIHDITIYYRTDNSPWCKYLFLFIYRMYTIEYVNLKKHNISNIE